MNVAIIPARGGSQRIPFKNIQSFCGKPIIAWSIEAAWASRCFSHVIVSTDNATIAGIAKEYGAEIPFIRPDELADHYTGTTAVTRHAVHWLLDHNYSLEHVCCIYATAPFVQGADLQRGLALLESKQYDRVFSACHFDFPFQRAIRQTAQGCEAIFPEMIGKRSQDLEETYHDAGQFYWGSVESWCDTEKNFFSAGSCPLILPRYQVQDIDTQEDWIQAELKFKQLRERFF